MATETEIARWVAREMAQGAAYRRYVDAEAKRRGHPTAAPPDASLVAIRAHLEEQDRRTLAAELGRFLATAATTAERSRR